MKKLLLVLALCVITSTISSMCFSAFSMPDTEVSINYSVEDIIKNLLKASNEHNLDEVAAFYSNDYKDADNINKKQLLKMIKDTWDNYPTISYSSEIKDVRVSENWASVETVDSAIGTTSKISDITNDKGDLKSNSHTLTYLRKIGKEWKIVSDYVYFENAEVKFGTAKNIEVKFSAPEQVPSGEMYSAKLLVDPPIGTFAVGSITHEPIIYPSIKPKERFRSMDPTIGGLERVFESNDTNNNELVTATVGITELTEDNLARPTVKLKGIYIITSRVNVIPTNKFDMESYKKINKEELEESKNNSTENMTQQEEDSDIPQENDE